ncbi:unnamed protein product [Closterium sp. Naga37s-1]|nr:unnamed protein product [Closterium sp. Naga37s-1]
MTDCSLAHMLVSLPLFPSLSPFPPRPSSQGYGRTNLLFSPASDGLVPFAMTDCSLARPHAFALLAHVRQAFLSCLLPHPSLDLPLPVFDWLPSLEHEQVQQLPVQQLPVQQLPVQQLPVQQLPVQQLPVQQLPVQQLTVQQLPVQQLRVKQLAL